jgi:hypothetical protein
LRSARTQHDFFQTPLGGFQLCLAMRLQCLPAFVQRDGVFKIDLALLQARDDRFQFLERAFEAQLLDGLVGFWNGEGSSYSRSFGNTRNCSAP